MIKSVTLKNFKRHKSLTLDFTGGFNVIMGQNSAGKSTVLNAIAFALYGSSAIPGTTDTLVTKGEKSMSVSVTLQIGGDEFEITRTAKSAAVKKNGEMIASGAAPVSEWVHKTFNANVEEFLTFTYSRQGETAALLTLGATKFQKKIEQMAKVDLIEKVISKLSDKTKHWNGMLEGLQVEDIEALESELEEVKSAYKRDFELHKTHQDALKVLTDNRSEKEIVYNKYKELEEELEVLSEKKADIVRTIKTVDEVIEDCLIDLQEIPEDCEGRLKVVNETITTSKKQLRDAELFKEKVDRIEAKIEEVENWLNEEGYPSMERYEEVKPDLDEAHRLVEQYTNELQEFKNEVSAKRKELQDKENELKSGVCQACGRPFETFDPNKVESEIDQIKQELAHLEVKIEAAEASLSASKKTIKDLEEYVNDVYKLGVVEVVESQREAHIRLKTQLSNLYSGDVPAANVEDLRKSIELLEAQRTELQALANKKEMLTDTIESNRRKKAKLQANLKSIVLDIEAVMSELPEKVDKAHLENEIAELTKKINVHEKALWELAPKIQMQVDKIKALKASLEKAKTADKKRRDVEKRISLAKELSTFLKKRRMSYMENIWDVILSTASEIVANATSEMENPIDRVLIDDKGKFMFESGGNVFYVQGGAGGCQLEMLGVAMRLALSNVFYEDDVGFMMLDEASSQMSDDNAINLASMLASTGKQILYVTHRKTEQLSAGNVITLGA
jgi:exonuclease SbcC